MSRTQGGGLHFDFATDEVALSNGWEHAGLRAEKDLFARTNFDPTKPAQAHRPKNTFKVLHTTAWFKDAAAAFHDSGAASLPTAESEAATFDYRAYLRDFMAMVTRNAAADVESRKQKTLVLDHFLPSLLLAQGQHWGEYELVRAMHNRLVPAFDDFGAWKYAKLTARLSLLYNCRSAMVNALNETHVGHSFSGRPGSLVAGDVLMEDHVKQIGIIASTLIQPDEWERRMCVRALNLGLRKQLLSSTRKDWAGLATTCSQRQASSIEYEVGLLSRAMLRVGINRPDPSRSLLRQNELGWMLKAHILKLSDASMLTVCKAACFGYVHDGMQPLLLSAAALLSGTVGSEEPSRGTVLMGITARPAAVATGGGGAWKVQTDAGGSEVATGHLRVLSGTALTVQLSSPQRTAFGRCKAHLRLEPWEDNGLSSQLRKPQPMQLLQVRWQQPPPPSLATVLPEWSVVTECGKPLEQLFNPPNSREQPRSISSVADDVVTALGTGRPIRLACAASVDSFAAAAVAQLMPIAQPGVVLWVSGRWLWMYHPALNPSARETTGFPKARVPGMMEELLREAAPRPEPEPLADAPTAALTAAATNNLRVSTTQRCLKCRLGVGLCVLPGTFGHLPEEVAFCLACSGKEAKKNPSLRRPCRLRGSRTKTSLGHVAGRHWPESQIKTLSQPAPSLVALGGRPTNWAATVADVRVRSSRSSQSAQAAAERRVAVISLLHDYAAKAGAPADPVLPGGRPGRKPGEDSGITVSDAALEGRLPPPTENHKLPYVRKQLDELVADGEASRFARDLAFGARSVREALSQAEPPALSAAPPVSGVGAHAAQQLRAQRSEAAKKQREKEHEIRVELAQAKRRRDGLDSTLRSKFHIRGRGGVQKSAGVSLKRADAEEVRMATSELEAEERTVTRLQQKLDATRVVTLTGSSLQGSASVSSQPQSDSTLLQATDRLADSAKVGGWALLDAGGDAKHGDGAKIGGKELRYYTMRITAARRELAAALRTDWGTLEAGTHVLDGEYAYLVYKPGNPARWYVMGQPARHVTIPTHLLLRVGFPMQTAVTPAKPSRQQRIACERDAVVLSAEEHAAALAVLRQRQQRA